jgi:putative transposase
MTSIRHHNVYKDGAVCFWTSSVVEFVPIFRSRTAARRLITIWEDSRRRCGVKIIGYVVMPNHIHIAVWAGKSESSRQFVNQMLKRSSMDLYEMTRKAAESGDELAGAWLRVFRSHAGSTNKIAVWKERGRAFPVSEAATLAQKLRYIHENPLRRGLVENAEDWEFSSASWYASGPGPITVDGVDGW